MTFRGSPLLRSLLGAKQTCRFALHMSAFDPKRTCSQICLAVYRTTALCAKRATTLGQRL
jgi:hypothetical protein